ncbi:MAG: MG2 domain-containing protein, partial [Gammaproteobacteria bacterium]|nr:MG2 domain-containing protein [Gammaproteobacteria bacterium]
MATHARQSQFRWRIPLGIFGLLSGALLATATIAEPPGGDIDEPVESGYTPYQGEPFFLLTDTSYGSNQEAHVRLEVSNRDFSGLSRYGGVDIVVYKIDDPLKFLKGQKNLHRIQTNGNYTGEGLANTLNYLWNDWYRKSRRGWQDIFSGDARKDIVTATPALKMPRNIDQPTDYQNHPQFAPMPKRDGFQYIDRFRYPVTMAQPIKQPDGVFLQGSSSNFMMSQEGNVYIPLGKRPPGLYLVEAIAGGYRANTVIFVADTIAITKVSAKQLMVWAARRDNGASAGNTQLLWTDGVGVIAQGATDARGIATFSKNGPEKSYVIGRDAQGGVFISENFYYDSEIYNAKIYAITDRPLYRPGDSVFVKFAGRQFVSSRLSEPLTGAALDIQVLDPNGTPVVAQKLQLSPQSGAQTQFRLPEDAVAGGYEIRYVYKDNTYNMAFRVAEYIKPHFEIHVQPAKQNFKTNEPIQGELVLTYPDGQPVKSAKVQLTVRAQTTTMVEGEIRYTGLFPVGINSEELTTNDRGIAPFKLPAAKNPSRYVLSVFASDGAAYRVKTSKELLIERSASLYTLIPAQKFGLVNTAVRFAYEAVPSGAPLSPPVRYEAVQLETQTKNGGSLNPGTGEFSVNFTASGSYSVFLYDTQNNIVGSANYWAIGPGIKAAKGSIDIVLNRAAYKPGEIAEALITFPDFVDSALLTLERDSVEKSGLIQKGDTWITAQRIGGTQWRAKIPVSADFAPNITFSIAYIKNGEWAFQNQGILVEQPRVAIAISTDKEVYQPGETVKVELKTTVGGKPVAANVHIGVVDEMIYVLQPEIAPDIFDYFYHPRRNNVRTHSSLQFIGYDLASNQAGGPPSRGSTRERGVKVLERPRRENVDTAYWNGDINTDTTGS